MPVTLQLTPQLHFSREEFAARRARVLEAMAKRGWDGMLVFRQESMYYLTGYDTFGYVFFQCLYLSARGEMTLLTRAPDLRQAMLTSVIEDIRIWKDAPDANPAAALRDIAREHKAGRLGVEWDSYGLTAKNGQLVADAFSDIALEDASAVVSEFRVIKSPAELEYVRRAAELADDGLKEAAQLAKPGAFEGDILAAMQGAVFRGGGEYSGNEFIIGSGERALLCRSFAGRRRLSPNDQLTLEFAGAYRHYHAALMRTIVIGEPSARHLQMREVCEEARLRCKEALRPGAALGEVFSAYAGAADNAGMKHCRLNATGYSLGTTFAPNWMDWPMIYENNEFIARPNMVFFVHIILMDEKAGAAMTTGETYVVGENGAIPLSAARNIVICLTSATRKDNTMSEHKQTGAVFHIKWAASVIQILGYAATGFGFTPWNAYFFIVGLIGWFAVGVMWNDRAIMLIHIVAFASLVTGMLS